MIALADPEDLYTVDADLPELAKPVMLYSLDGFIDAGAPGALVTEHLLGSLEHHAVATFDVDRLIDYRSRRPVMTFVKDHWESYDAPELVLHEVQDEDSTPFLLLTGPEPDHEWELFLAAVLGLFERLDVRVAVGFHGIPMAVPHTRPLGLTAHATRPELISGYKPFLNRVQVPGSASALLELRLGEFGHDAIGFAVHVPHYLAQAPYPAAAVAALDAIIAATGLALPVDPMRERAKRADAEITRQVEGSDEIKSLVQALEEQYEAYSDAGQNLLADDTGILPTADELAAQFEQFLAQQDRRGEEPEV
ncbi:MAG TPA: PAC2 family protein [Streptosporangiaceae bacterium]|nr:PAC2 family protein [Streptosporangiaceae bacterium]